MKKDRKINFILVKGFWYSGTSAIIDFLYDHSGVVKHFNGRNKELRLVKQENTGLYDLQKKIKKNKLTSADIRNLHYKLDPDLDDKSHDASRVLAYNMDHGKKAVLLHNSLVQNLYALAKKMELIQEGGSFENIYNEFRDICIEYLESVYGVLCENIEGQVALVDNDPGALFTDYFHEYIDPTEFYKNFKEIYVFRDFRDILECLTRRELLSNDSMTPRNYINNYYGSILLASKNKNSPIFVKFESFARDASVRGTISQLLNLKKTVANIFFDQSYSSANVGRFNYIINNVEIKKLFDDYKWLIDFYDSLPPLFSVRDLNNKISSIDQNLNNSNTDFDRIALFGFSPPEIGGVWTQAKSCRIVAPVPVKTLVADQAYCVISFKMFSRESKNLSTKVTFFYNGKSVTIESINDWEKIYKICFFVEPGNNIIDLKLTVINEKKSDEAPIEDIRNLGIFLTDINFHRSIFKANELSFDLISTFLLNPLSALKYEQGNSELERELKKFVTKLSGYGIVRVPNVTSLTITDFHEILTEKSNSYKYFNSAYLHGAHPQQPIDDLTHFECLFNEGIVTGGVVAQELFDNALTYKMIASTPICLTGLFGTGRNYLNAIINKLGYKKHFFDCLPNLIPAYPAIYSGHFSCVYKKKSMYDPDYFRTLADAAHKNQISIVAIIRNPLDSLVTNFIYWYNYVFTGQHVLGISSEFGRSNTLLIKFIEENINKLVDFIKTGDVNGMDEDIFFTFEQFLEETKVLINTDSVHVIRFESFFSDNMNSIVNFQNLCGFNKSIDLEMHPLSQPNISNFLRHNSRAIDYLFSDLEKNHIHTLSSIGYPVS